MKVLGAMAIWGMLATTGVVLASSRESLLFTIPPFTYNGAVYVPARQFCNWLGAEIEWLSDRQGVRVTWRGQEKVWKHDDGDLILRKGRIFLQLRAFAEAYKIPLTWQRGALPFVELDECKSSIHASIPVGWHEAAMPKGLTDNQQQIWRLLSRPRTISKRDRLEARDIRVVRGWARASVHPLNFVTDDLCVILEKRAGTWRVLGSGTDFSPERNFGIPAYIRRQLGVPGW